MTNSLDERGGGEREEQKKKKANEYRNNGLNASVRSSSNNNCIAMREIEREGEKETCAVTIEKKTLWRDRSISRTNKQKVETVENREQGEAEKQHERNSTCSKFKTKITSS